MFLSLADMFYPKIYIRKIDSSKGLYKKFKTWKIKTTAIQNFHKLIQQKAIANFQNTERKYYKETII